MKLLIGLGNPGRATKAAAKESEKASAKENK